MITCYAEPSKAKSVRLIEAFAQGCGGNIASAWSPRLEPGAAAFYGMREKFAHLLKQAKDEGRHWYAIDNSWFDASRERYFRVGRNAMQSWSSRPSDGERLKALGVRVQPWRSDGKHVVVACQSDEYLRLVGKPDWLGDVLRQLAERTARPVIVRTKGATRPLADDLRDAWLLVAYSSAAAVEALMAGIPVVVTDEHCAAAPFGTMWGDVESPRRADGREEWAARLADSQWTEAELRDGTAWRALQ